MMITDDDDDDDDNGDGGDDGCGDAASHDDRDFHWSCREKMSIPLPGSWIPHVVALCFPLWRL